MNDIRERFITFLVGVIVSMLFKGAAAIGIDPHTLDPGTVNLVATGILTFFAGWATKHWTDWGKVSAPKPPDDPRPDVDHELKRS